MQPHAQAQTGLTSTRVTLVLAVCKPRLPSHPSRPCVHRCCWANGRETRCCCCASGCGRLAAGMPLLWTPSCASRAVRPALEVRAAQAGLVIRTLGSKKLRAQ